VTRLRYSIHRSSALLLALVLGTAATGQAQEKRPLTYVELMQFRQIENVTLSRDGGWVAFTAEPDRGDPEVIVRATDGATRYVLPLASHPLISADGRWVAARRNPSLEETEAAENGERPKNGLSLLDTRSGAVVEIDRVRAFAFSEDGRWLAVHHFEEEEEEEEEEEDSAAAEERGNNKDRNGREAGTTLVVRSTAGDAAIEIDDVRSFAFDSTSHYIAYAVADTANARDGLYVRDLTAGDFAETILEQVAFGHYANFAWSPDAARLAYTAAVEDEDGKAGSAVLRVWDGDEAWTAVDSTETPEGWEIPADNGLEWSEDGERLFFGYRPEDDDEDDDEGESAGAGAGEEAGFDAYDVEEILAERGVDVWHWNDPLIIPNQKEDWEDEQERTYLAVFHLAGRRAVPLADQELRIQGAPENPRMALAGDPTPYLQERTWAGSFADVYVVDLADGSRQLVSRRRTGGSSTVRGWTGRWEASSSLSPEGRYLVYYQDEAWHLYNTESGATRNLTLDVPVSFADEDHDYPNSRPGYGVGGWADGERAVLIHDKYDVWQFPTGGGEPVNLTRGEGRAALKIYRVLRIDPEQKSFPRNSEVYLTSFDERLKNFGFYRTRADRGGLEQLLEDEKRYAFLTKAEDADVFLFTREDYDEFPDLWVGRAGFEGARKITDVNPQIAEFAWGSEMLIEYESLDGVTLHGAVILPGNYEEGQRYPVLTYFYRFFSQRLHAFNEPVINHRPSFPMYASNGYIVFLPDVRFEVGRPGYSAMKSVVPGVRELVDMGLADPDRLGLHGHSWSGYTTAFIVTQTDIFAAAVAGAPVSNMTSAYGGIRWGSGRARQFQYEAGQSRLSGSLWEARQDYIENSPLFYADRVDTPLLIMHGDEDEAVPWYQSIEYYLALRRNQKNAIFLQYRNEPHHPRKYANKLDYSIRMMEFFDHYLKGEPAPAWITEGVPYNGH
jgi:dipeptidyl aminopeptidase/acylaminoacyl peptidase